ncbi:dihydropteroate synthase [Acetobacteraceae bacterium ESL0709]|nr:dihydropteroate synthase [Acetobacteraceae bacterium ESL0697]MDF7678900.1 dihydropteroate synthase [Acetobacteraceae bacterium ESL0709]
MKTLGDLIRASQEGNVPPLIMGIVNVTPDSFSDGGAFYEAELACAHAMRLVKQGADLIDCGAESTRPGYSPVDVEEEWRRLAPVVTSLVARGICVSVDTMKAEIARRVLEAGAVMINDIWGLHRDGDMASVVAAHGAQLVVMHNREEIDPNLDMKADFRRFFDISLEKAHFAGIASGAIVLDPGIGFGKTPEQNLKALRHLAWLKQEYRLPILLGLSRKSLFGYFLGRPKDERLPATIAANLYGIREGASILRVHDVKAHEDAVLLDYMLRGVS